MLITQENVSTFARMVDKLRTVDKAELKLAYLRLFKNDLAKEWESITSEMDFSKISDEEIVAAIQKTRYGNTNV